MSYKKQKKIEFYELKTDIVDCVNDKSHVLTYISYDFITEDNKKLTRYVKKCKNCEKMFLDTDKFNELRRNCIKYNFITKKELILRRDKKKKKNKENEKGDKIRKVNSINIYLVNNIYKHGCNENNFIKKDASYKDNIFKLYYCRKCRKYYADRTIVESQKYGLFPKKFRLFDYNKMIKDIKLKEKEKEVDEYIKHHFDHFISKEKEQISKNKNTKIEMTDIEFFKILKKIKSDNNHDFIIKGNTSYCTNNHHRVIDIEATINIIDIDGKEEKISCPANYCDNCKVFYISNFTYGSIRKRGFPLCKLYDMYKFKKDNKYFDLNPESILHLFGYSVAYNNNLTMFQRQTILKNIIDCKIMSKHKVLDFLLYLHSRGKNRTGYENAVERWEDDIEFVEHYNRKNVSSIEVSSITRIHYKIKGK